MKPCTFPRSFICTLAVVLLVLASPASAARKEKVLYSFQGGTDGAVPSGGVVFDKAGNLYGATQDGGGSGCAPISPCGTAFQLVKPAKQGNPWTENQLHVFTGVTKNAKDGAGPTSGLVMDAAANLFGTTAYGGTGGCVLVGNHGGCGTVYELTPPKKKNGKWTYKIIYSFRGGKDGYVPAGDLVFDGAGNLYGATQFGGGFGNCDSPFYQFCGTVFELSPPQTKGSKWTEHVLYSFKSGRDGANPNGGLVFDSKGAIYGTTSSGANQTCKGDGYTGCGSAFKLTPPMKAAGFWTETILHRFSGYPSDGELPSAGIVFDEDGDLFGTATGGGREAEGIVFKLVPRHAGHPWSESLLHQFTSGEDGSVPRAALSFDMQGNLYGSASGGGAVGGGTLFRFRRTSKGNWAFAPLYTFTGAPNGSYPAAAGTFDNTDSLYGTTEQSGSTGKNCGNRGCGTVFEITP